MEQKHGPGLEDGIDVGSGRDAQLGDKGTDAHHNQLGGRLHMLVIHDLKHLGTA